MIHRLNYNGWPQIIESAKQIGIDQLSFLPADVSSHAFNREMVWDEKRKHEILLENKDLDELRSVIDYLLVNNKDDFNSRFIAESREKIQHIYSYYAAFYGHNDFPYKKCNAPWVSVVVEADGTVRPCFFHQPYGNIKNETLDKIINSENAIDFRRNLDTFKNETCVKCVCYLNLSPGTML